MADKKYQLTEIEAVLNKFSSMVDEINSLEAARLKIASAISDKKTLYRYHKKFTAFQKAVQLYTLMAQEKDINRVAEERDRVAQELVSIEPELASLIKNFKLPDKSEFLWLNSLGFMLSEERQEQWIAYLKQHGNEVLAKLNSFNDRKTAEEFRRQILLLGGEEINELNMCIEDIEKWGSYRLANRIDFFTERLMIYVNGGTTSDGITFKGLRYHFRDIELVKQMLSVQAVRKLWTYKNELRFFSWARYVIQRSLRATKGTEKFEKGKGKEKGGWEGFYEFYNNLRNGKNYIRLVGDKFGNPEFAELLERIKEKIHESPVDWDKELAELEHRLHDIPYQNRYVLEPARQALTSLFNSRINELTDIRGNAAGNIKRILSSRMANLSDKGNLKKELAGLLRSYKKKIEKEWEENKAGYTDAEVQLLLILAPFIEMVQRLLQSMDKRKNYANFKMASNMELATLGDLQQLFNSMHEAYSRPTMDETVIERLEIPILLGLHRRHRIVSAEDKLMENLGTVSEEELSEMKKIIEEGRNTITPKIKELIIYASELIRLHFVPEAQNVLRGD